MSRITEWFYTNTFAVKDRSQFEAFCAQHHLEVFTDAQNPTLVGCAHQHLGLRDVASEAQDADGFLRRLGIHLQDGYVAIVIDAHLGRSASFETSWQIAHAVNNTGAIETIDPDTIFVLAQKLGSHITGLPDMVSDSRCEIQPRTEHDEQFRIRSFDLDEQGFVMTNAEVDQAIREGDPSYRYEPDPEDELMIHVKNSEVMRIREHHGKVLDLFWILHDHPRTISLFRYHQGILEQEYNAEKRLVTIYLWKKKKIRWISFVDFYVYEAQWDAPTLRADLLYEQQQEIISLAGRCGFIHPSKVGLLPSEFAKTFSAFLDGRESIRQFNDHKASLWRDLSITSLLLLGKLVTQACVLRREGYQQEWQYLREICGRYQIDLEKGIQCALQILQWYQNQAQKQQMIYHPFSVYSSDQYRIAADLLHILLPTLPEKMK